MNTTPKQTSKQDQKMASLSLANIRGAGSRFRKDRTKGVKIKLEETGEQITIPETAFSILVEVLSNMSEGKSLTILTAETELSTQKAAEILKVSRPHLVKLLETGILPFRKVGSHRRILLYDLIKYDEKLKNNREKQLTFLAKQAQELNLGYE